MHHLMELPEIFASASGKISVLALKKCLLQHGKIEQELTPCNGHRSSAMEIYYVQDLAAIVNNRNILTVLISTLNGTWNRTEGCKSRGYLKLVLPGSQTR